MRRNLYPILEECCAQIVSHMSLKIIFRNGRDGSAVWSICCSYRATATYNSSSRRASVSASPSHGAQTSTQANTHTCGWQLSWDLNDSKGLSWGPIKHTGPGCRDDPGCRDGDPCAGDKCVMSSLGCRFRLGEKGECWVWSEVLRSGSSF